jgi:hypothetical protein
MGKMGKINKIGNINDIDDIDNRNTGPLRTAADDHPFHLIYAIYGSYLVNN